MSIPTRLYFDEKTYEEKLFKLIQDGNPCVEYRIPPLKLTDFAKEYPSMITLNKNTDTPHSQREPINRHGSLSGQYSVDVPGKGLSGVAKLSDQEIRVEVNVPGIEPDKIKVKRVNSIVRVYILDDNGKEQFDNNMYSPSKYLEYFLAEDETVTDVEIDLGVLTIYINRNAEVEEFTL